MRRHLLRRSKLFDCNCEACTAPDQLAALPCPACVPRDPATGLVPRSLLLGKALELLKHPVVVPDGVSAAAPTTPPAWRCDTCGGVFSAECMAEVQIAAGVVRPAPRTSSLKQVAEPAGLLDVVRWAEAATIQMLTELPHSAVGRSTALSKADFLMGYVFSLLPIVGTAHAAVLRLLSERLQTLHLVTVEAHDGALPTAASTAARLSGHVPMLDRQLPSLRIIVSAPGAQPTFPPDALATAITGGTAAMWPRLRAAGLLRSSSSNPRPVELLSFTIQLVQCLGMAGDPTLAGPLSAMLRELPPKENFSEDLQMVVAMSHLMLRTGGMGR